MNRRILPFFIALIVLSTPAPVPAAERIDPAAERTDLAAAALSLSADWNRDLDRDRYRGWIDDHSKQLRRRLAGVTGEGRIDVINRFFFDELKFQAVRELTDPDFLFIDRVIDGRAGYCVGLATLYLALGTGAGVPLHAVAAPGHVFLRYDDGASRRNIELTEKGRALADDDYVHRYKIPEESVESGVFLRSLSIEQFLGQILNNRGVLFSRRGEYAKARADYRRALKRDRLLQVVYYNRGIDWLQVKSYRNARKDLSRAIDLNRNDAEAWNNRGVAFEKLGKLDVAARDFHTALALRPGFHPAADNLEKLKSLRPEEH